jgi:hypothetical protein
MEALDSLVEIFHSLSLFVVLALIALTLVVSWVMVRVFKGDFDNQTSQF